jgi:hypothetical protein
MAGRGSKKSESRGNRRKRRCQADPAIPRNGGILATRIITKNYLGALPPRELIKYVQDYFHEDAMQLQKMLALVRAGVDITPPDDLETNAALSREIMGLKAEIREALVTSADMAFKNLPYFHAKVSPAENIQREIADSPLEILKMLFQEIEELGRGRPIWMQGQPRLDC